MNRLRCWVLGLGLGLLLASVAWTEEKPKRPEGFPPPNPLPFGDHRPLLTPALLEKLELTAEQKEKIEKLLKHFEKTQTEAMTKFREAVQKIGQEKDPEAARKLPEKFREFQQSAQKQRTEAENKFKDVLTEEQKKKFEELKKQLPPFPGPQPPFPPGAFRPFPGQVLPMPLQELLKLSPEQKEKINKVQKEAETKIVDVLNEEQKKQLEEIKKRFGTPFPLPPGELPRKE